MGKINGKYESEGQALLLEICDDCFSHWKQQLSVKCFLRATLFKAQSQTFAQLDVSVYTSADTSLTGAKCISFVHVALVEDKSAVTRGDNTDFNLKQASVCPAQRPAKSPLSHKQGVWQGNVVCLSLEGHGDGSQGHVLAPFSLMAACPSQKKKKKKIPVCAWDS